MNFLSGIQATSSALQAEKLRMDLVAQNIANANTTKGLDGEPYKRKVANFEAMVTGTGETGVRVRNVTEDQSAGAAVYNPHHPQADKDGMVRMPNVNPSTEMVDLLSASRAYEANLAVVRNARQMASRALQIGK